MTSKFARKNRSRDGIVLCLKDLSDGQSPIDDVVADDSAAQSPVWRHKEFNTQSTYPNHKLDRMALSGEEYCQIGVAIVARLLAISGRVSD